MASDCGHVTPKIDYSFTGSQLIALVQEVFGASAPAIRHPSSFPPHSHPLPPVRSRPFFSARSEPKQDANQVSEVGREGAAGGATRGRGGVGGRRPGFAGVGVGGEEGGGQAAAGTGVEEPAEVARVEAERGEVERVEVELVEGVRARVAMEMAV